MRVVRRAGAPLPSPHPAHPLARFGARAQRGPSRQPARLQLSAGWRAVPAAGVSATPTSPTLPPAAPST